MNPITYTTSEAAALLGVTRRHVCNLIAAGILPAQRFGRALVIRRSDLHRAARKPGPGRPRGAKNLTAKTL